MNTAGFTHYGTPRRKRDHLCLYTKIVQEGQRGEVTSINNERAVIVLKEQGVDKPRRIIKATHEVCRELWPAPKKKKTS